MYQYLGKRLLGLMPVLLGITLLVFSILHLIPGDPVTVLLGERATPEQVALVKQQLGLDQALWIQYLAFLRQIVTLNLGTSLVSGLAIATEIQTRFPATLELAIAAMLIALGVGLPLGIGAAVWRNSWVDKLAVSSSLLGVSLPVYWLGLLLIYLFAVNLQWLPPSDRLSLATAAVFRPVTNLYLLDAVLGGNWLALGDGFAHLLLPAATLSTIPLAIVTRLTRTAMLETLGQDYIRTARAKGLVEYRVIGQHALKNALLPVVTTIGLQFGTLLGGAILTETIFSWPGIGSWLYEGILHRDYPVVQGGVLVVATAFVVINLVVDLSYQFIDPRIRLH